MTEPRFTHIKITGDISVEPVTRVPNKAFIYLLMGPTGAGKSSFIEALNGDLQNLSISSNGLAGYTQAVDAYRLVNVRWEDEFDFIQQPAYLVDTPGFCDSKISEIEVMDTVRDWLKENKLPTVRRIIYFTPITDTRLAGSRRRTLEMLEQFLVSTGTHGSVSLATTMWDTLPNERTRNRAELNFSQLRRDICNGSHVYYSAARFMNTRTSALQVLDVTGSVINIFSPPLFSASKHLYRDLHERIECALQKKVMIEEDLVHSELQANKNLKIILKREHKENDETLAKFIVQLVKFGKPPREFQEAAHALRKTILAFIVPADHHMRDVFKCWADKPEIRRGLVSDAKLTETILAMLAEKPVSRGRREPIPSGGAVSEKLAENLPSTQSDSERHQDSEPIQTETISSRPSGLGPPTDLVVHRPLRTLSLKGLLRYLIRFAKSHHPKWLKREE